MIEFIEFTFQLKNLTADFFFTNSRKQELEGLIANKNIAVHSVQNWIICEENWLISSEQKKKLISGTCL